MKPEPRRRLNLGSGRLTSDEYLNFDIRAVDGLDVQGDVRALPFPDNWFDEILASSILEHFSNPYVVLREMHRVISPQGEVRVLVPAIGTYSAHLDTTHKFLADLKLWKRILGGYFSDVRVKPLGVRYRDNKLLTAINHGLVYGLQFKELAMGWDLRCRGKRTKPVKRYKAWWLE